ncbi:MAG TPA: DUF2911 domain-containing protein [Gemmatimonadales bacterium]|nr:DUF2911 domain-containing protein [Gemmatimonadales bacterium]
MISRGGIFFSFASVTALAVLTACGPSETDAETLDTAAATAAAEGTSSFSCFVRGATRDEAMARPSPLGEVEIAMGENEALLCYGRPSANGRVVMGELVPYGSPWRLGANEATAIHMDFAGQIGSVDVEPGSYSLYAIPGEQEWEFVVNRQVERWGIPINDSVRADDIGTFRRPVATNTNPVEQLTFAWQSHGEGMGHLVMTWENTRVEVPIHVAGAAQ